jgi:hypothetical protein
MIHILLNRFSADAWLRRLRGIASRTSMLSPLS